MNKPELTIDYEYQDNDKIHLWVTVTFAEGEEPPSGILKLAVESTNPSREIKAAETYGDRCEFDFNIVPDEVADYLATASWRANKPEELNNFAGPEDASQTSLAPSDSASEEILSGGNRTQLSIHVWNAAEALAPPLRLQPRRFRWRWSEKGGISERPLLHPDRQQRIRHRCNRGCRSHLFHHGFAGRTCEAVGVGDDRRGEVRHLGRRRHLFRPHHAFLYG
ncbi:MAG: hypothetical protein LUG50_00920 [Planctomycetaceae bacterium]|nr:hypothetical protein [Planctomycetaceae bacterium]